MGKGGFTYTEFLTEAQYLKVEEAAEERNEYVAGRVYAMSGATLGHATVTHNLSRLLHQPAKGNGCKVYSIDLKLRIAHANCYYYPDVTVTCEPFDPSMTIVSAPRLIIEVLSKSTESIDRREKMIAYHSIDSVIEYAIAHQDEPLIEVYKKDPAGGWTMVNYKDNQSVRFESFANGPVEIPLAEIYDWMDLIGHASER